MGIYIKLTDYKSSEIKEKEFFNLKNRYIIEDISVFNKITGSPLAFWVSEKGLRMFEYPNLSKIAAPRSGLTTGNNDRFIRNWTEVKKSTNGFGDWLPVNSGSDFRKWYGSDNYLIYWANDGYDIKNNAGATMETTIVPGSDFKIISVRGVMRMRLVKNSPVTRVR